MAQKKPIPTKAAIQTGKEIVTLNQAYAWGNFHAARVQAKAILANKELSDVDHKAAQKMLKMTGVDPWALLVGFLCAAFTTTVAFLVGA